MAKSMKGVAASAAAVIAISMAGGPGIAVALASPRGGGSGSSADHDGGHAAHDGSWHRGRSAHDGDRRDRVRSDRDQGNRDQGNRDQGNRDQGGDRDRGPGGGRDRDPGGGDHWQGSGDPGDGSSADDGHSIGVASSTPAARPATVSRVVTAAATPSSATDSGAVGPVAIDPPAAASVGTGGSGAALARAGLPTALTVPRVVVGDGRSPAFLRPAESATGALDTARAVPRPNPLAPAPVRGVSTPPPPMPIESPAPAMIISVPWPLADTPIPSMWKHVQPGWPAGALFGIAGLLLAPIGGVWLGHRQARATKAASQLVSR